VGVAGLPAIVATGPFDNQPYAERLAAAFAMVRLQCRAQLVLVGNGAHRATIMRRGFAQGAGTLIAAADVVVPGLAGRCPPGWRGAATSPDNSVAAPRNELSCKASRTATSIAADVAAARKEKGGTNMYSILDRLVLWVAEILDRSLLTVPELND
jgi:hypothetical protein